MRIKVDKESFQKYKTKEKALNIIKHSFIMTITLSVIFTSGCLLQDLYFGTSYKFNLCVNFHVNLYRNKNLEELWVGKRHHEYHKGIKEIISNIYLFWRDN